ncbi:MAG TPA: hypothetical protein VJ385_03340 [Fibrobacteria bacterium]|nr:hypothetical protein [Fibrobacteria bacterium]
MQAAKVIQLVYDRAIRPDRIAQSLKAADSQGRHLIALIYASEERGAAEAELLGSLEGFPPSQSLMLLGKLEQELLIFSREIDKTRTFHGFREMADEVLPAVLGEPWLGGAGSETASWISFRHFLSGHLCHFLCQVALGSVKITQSGEMHRKDAQELAQRFTFGERLSTALPAEEVQLLLHFAVGASLVLQEDGLLYLSAEGKALLRGERRDAWRRLAEWWMESRVHGLAHTLKALASLPAEPVSGRIASWANVLWIYSGQHRKGFHDPKASFTWENLPKVLQELWLLGLIDFGMVKGRIAWVRPERTAIAHLSADLPAEGGAAPDANRAGADEGNTGHPPRPISLPNMESLVPLDSPLGWQHRLELVGHKSNDEFMGRYRFTKESVIQGLQAGLGMEEFKDLLSWLGFEGPARQTLLEWASTYASTLFMDALVLKVSDPVRFRELREIPQFLELVTEVIPEYGFVLNRKNKPRVKELLQHFGLVPGEDSRRTLDLAPVSLSTAGAAWELPRPEIGPPAYRESPGSLRAPPQEPKDKNGQASREQELKERIETLESAIAGEKKIEFSYAAPTMKRIALKPLLLLKHKDPIKFIGIELDSGHRNEYMLEQAKALRIVE